MVSSANAGDLLVGLSNDLAGAIERVGQSVVAVNARHRLPSSGVVWKEGVVVTADHTIEREEGITVTLPGGNTIPATLAGRDVGTDLAVLKLQGAQGQPARLGNESHLETHLKVGHIVLAVARPGERGLSASMGVISAVGGPFRTRLGGQIDHLVRPDLTFYPGFSGGALADAAGRVIGLNTSGLSRAMTVSIPVATVDRVAEQLLTRGHIVRGYLGVGLQPVALPERLQRELNVSGQGLIVVSIEPGGPAEQAGVLIGDILISLDGKRVTDPADVQEVLGPATVGKTIKAQVIRGGKLIDLNITVGERPRRED